MATAVTARHHNLAGRPREAGPLPANPDALDHATRLVHRVCCLAGSGDFVANIRANNRSLRLAIQDHDTPALFDWLIEALSYQGISDRVAHDYMEEHGRATWAEVAANLAGSPSCPKLKGYWRFQGCHYHKTSGTCAEPDHIRRLPAADPPVAERPPQPDGLLPVPVHSRHCRQRPGDLDRRPARVSCHAQ